MLKFQQQTDLYLFSMDINWSSSNAFLLSEVSSWSLAIVAYGSWYVQII